MKYCKYWLSFLCALLFSAPVLSNTYYMARGGLHSTPFTTWENAATNIQAAVMPYQEKMTAVFV